MPHRTSRGLCFWLAVCGGCSWFASADQVSAADNKGGPFHLDQVIVDRNASFFGPDPATDKILFKTGKEVLKPGVGKYEIAVSRSYYTLKAILTVEAPETVEDGQSVNIKATADAAWNLILKQPATSSGLEVSIGGPYGVKGDKKFLGATPQQPFHSGPYSLKAEMSTTATVGANLDQFFGGRGPWPPPEKNMEYRAFVLSMATNINGNFGTIAANWVYKRPKSAAAPVTPVTPARPVTPGRPVTPVAQEPGDSIFGTWKSDWGVITLTGVNQNVTGFWDQAPGKRGMISGGHYDPATRKLFFTYHEDWKNLDGTATLTLSPDGTSLSGTWKQSDGNGNWTIHLIARSHPNLQPNPHPQPGLIGKLPELPPQVKQQIAELQQQARLKRWSFQIGQNAVSHIPRRQLVSFHVPGGINLVEFVERVNRRGYQWLEADRRKRDEFNQQQPNVLTELSIEARTQASVYARKSRFDWRDYGKVTPVRDQGNCGSCWDFAALGAFECSHLIRNNAAIRGSEQQILDCVTKGDCQAGWHMDAFDYLIRHGTCAGDSYAYVDAKGACRNVTSPYKAVSWGFVAADGRMPSVEAMKTALCQHGPLAVIVHATPAFHNYLGGVFDENSPSNDPDDMHVVLIVGWDDGKGRNGAWAIRNSWTTGWGEAGYMWIEYGCNGIGDYAAWVEAESANYTLMTLLVNDYRVKQGQDVYAPVVLLNPTDVNNMDWVLNYDSSVAQLVEPSVLDGNLPLLAFRANPSQPNRILLAFAEHKPINTGGQLARIHFKAIGSPGSRTPLTLELKTISDPQLRHPPIKLVDGSIEIVKAEQERLRGSCCGQPKLVIEDAICALEMSVELRPPDLIMDMDGNNIVNSDDAAIIVRQVLGATRTGQ